MITTSRSYIEGLANAIASDNGITVREGENWVSDIKRRILTYDVNSLQRMSSLSVKGCILHEVSHLNYTKITPESAIAKKYPAMQEVYNTLEDMRIEELTKKKYGEFAESGFASVAIEAIQNHAFALQQKQEIPKLRQVLLGILNENTYHNGYNHFFTPDYFWEDYRTFNDNLDKEASEALDKIKALDVINKTYACNGIEDIKTLADTELFPILEPFLKDDKMQPRTCQVVVKKSKDDKEEGKPKGDKELEFNERANKLSEERQEQRKSKYIPNDKEIYADISSYITTLAHRLSDILKEKKSTRYTGAYLQGKLLSKNAFKVLTNETRIFSKKINPNVPNYTISLLLDESGSMLGGSTKLKATYIASYLLTQTVKRLGFNLNLIAYDHRFRLLKDLNEYREARGGENEESKVLDEVGRITNPKEENIVILMTDGGFCEEEATLKNAIKRLTDKNYTVIGMGIGLGSNDEERLKQGYPVALNAPNVEQLPNLMINLLRGLITR